MVAVQERVVGLRPRARPVLLGLLAALLAYGATELSDSWTPAGHHVALLWLPAGVGFGLVLVGGPVLALPVALAAVAEALFERGAVLAALVAGLGAGTAALAAVLPRRLGVGRRPEEVRATIVRLGAATLAAGAGASFTLAVIDLRGGPQYGAASTWGHAAAAQFAGILVVGPLLRTWLQTPLPRPASGAELAAMVVTSAALGELAGSDAIARAGPVAYLVFPAVLWGALRTGRRGTSLAMLAIAVAMTENLTYGRGPFAGARTSGGIALDGFLIVASLTAVLLASLAQASRRAQAEVRQSESRFRTLIERASDLVTVLDRQGRIVYESPALERVLGYHEQEPGSDAFELIHPADVAECRRVFAQVLEEPERPLEVSLRYRHRDGAWVSLVSTVRNLLDDPAVGGVVVNSRDVTHERQVEERYRALVEELPLVTYVQGPAAGDPPVYVSPQFEEIFGWPVEVWFEDPLIWRRVIHPDDFDLLDELFVARGRDSRRAEYRVVAADGRVVWVLDHMVTLRDESGRPVAVQGFLLDVSERRRLEEQLRTAQRLEAVGLLAGGVAHDFNNLLTAIWGYLELARTHVAEPDRALSDLDEVARATARAAELTRQLLAFARRTPVEQEVVDLNAVVEEALPLLERLAGKSVEVEARLDPQAGTVRANGAQLGQVLVNLVVNARDAMPEGGRVTIATGREDAHAFVAVADTGVGIEAAALERLFEPFFTTKDVGEGTGLGLAVVHGIVEQSGGRVVVRSEPGAGAEFRVLLPPAEARAPQPEAEQRTPPRGSETVLLVEDEGVVRRLTAEMLERQGYRVLAAGSPAEALAVEEPYELLLTDVVMPGMSGPDLARRLGDRRPDAAVLFTSGYSGAADAAALDGRLLEKPFTLEQLATRVRAALDARDRSPR